MAWQLEMHFSKNGRSRLDEPLVESSFEELAASDDRPQDILIRGRRIYLPVKNVIGMALFRTSGVCGKCFGHGTVLNRLPPGHHFISELVSICEQCGGTGLEKGV